MRAIVCEQFGKPQGLRLAERDPGPLAPDAVRIAVRACGVNFADLLMVAGKHQLTPELPFSPGGEVAGEIVALGSNVRSLQRGQRVMAVVFTGGLRELVDAPAQSVLPVPESLGDREAAVFQGGHSVAHYALRRRGGLLPDEQLLVLGAAGGVGLAGVQIGKALGARVIAAVGSAEKARAARREGADEIVEYREEDLKRRVRDLTEGRGADVVLDPVGGDAFDAATRCIARGGRLLVVGFASGRIPDYPVNLALLKNCSLVGVNHQQFFSQQPDLVSFDLEEQFAWLEEERIEPVVDRHYPLERSADALEFVASREAIGRVAVSLACSEDQKTG